MRYQHGSEPYPEKRLQLAALSWAKDNLGYRSIADDVEATGAPFDAIGTLGGNVVLIETKTDILPATVRYDPRATGTIEPKIARALLAVYRGDADGQAGIINRAWKRGDPLAVIILAGNFSDSGLRELSAMLAERSQEWFFNYRVWRWTGQNIEELFQNTISEIPNNFDWSSIIIPEMIAKPSRNKPASLHKLQAAAAERGVLNIFSAILERSNKLEMKQTRRVTGINLHTPAKHETWCSIFLFNSDSSNGINCGIYADLYDESGCPLPGTWAPRSGFMNTNRFIKSIADVEKLFAPFAKEL